MPENILDREQAEELIKHVGPMLGFIGRLQRRMADTGKLQDELYPLVAHAYDAVMQLRMGLHYRTCERDVDPAPHV